MKSDRPVSQTRQQSSSSSNTNATRVMWEKDTDSLADKGLARASLHAAKTLHAVDAHTLTALRSAAAAAPSPELKTMPGESSSLMCLSKWISCSPFVTPGVLPTCGCARGNAHTHMSHVCYNKQNMLHMSYLHYNVGLRCEFVQELLLLLSLRRGAAAAAAAAG